MIPTKILTLEKAELFVKYREIYSILMSEWYAITDVEYDALAYLVKHSSSIILPNVKSLTDEKKQLLKNYTGFFVIVLTVN